MALGILIGLIAKSMFVDSERDISESRTGVVLPHSFFQGNSIIQFLDTTGTKYKFMYVGSDLVGFLNTKRTMVGTTFTFGSPRIYDGKLYYTSFRISA